MPEYRVVFRQPPGEHRHPAVYLDADNDAEAMGQVVARWTREQVIAVHWVGGERSSIRRVWSANS